MEALGLALGVEAQTHMSATKCRTVGIATILHFVFVYEHNITSRILKDFSPKHTGLDYGCGNGPVITAQLEKIGYTISVYDL